MKYSQIPCSCLPTSSQLCTDRPRLWRKQPLLEEISGTNKSKYMQRSPAEEPEEPSAMFQGFFTFPPHHTSSYAISPVASLAISTAPAALSLHYTAGSEYIKFQGMWQRVLSYELLSQKSKNNFLELPLRGKHIDVQGQGHVWSQHA